MIIAIDTQIVETFSARPRKVDLCHLLQCLAAARLRIRWPNKNYTSTHSDYQNDFSHGLSEMRELIYLVEIFFNAAAIPASTELGLSTAQKCMKNSRGCSDNMWLCSAVTEILWAWSSEMTGFTSSAMSTKSPVVATFVAPAA